MRFGKEIGPVGDMPAEQVVRAAQMVREGRMVSLAATRFPGMPLFPGHPPFQVLNYRTPRGIRATGAQPWGAVNDAGLGYMAYPYFVDGWLAFTGVGLAIGAALWIAVRQGW